MTLGVRDGKLSFADATKSVKNDRPTVDVAIECLPDLSQLLLSRDKVFRQGFRSD